LIIEELVQYRQRQPRPAVLALVSISPADNAHASSSMPGLPVLRCLRACAAARDEARYLADGLVTVHEFRQREMCLI
jgi:hypothetical protein